MPQSLYLTVPFGWTFSLISFFSRGVILFSRYEKLRIAMFTKSYLTLLILLTLLACARDKSPLEPPKAKLARPTIKGRAYLQNQADHYGIFVYLEVLRQYALTDEKGEYTLTLADSLFSGDTLAIQGTFHIYYSFPYYDFDSTLVVTDKQGFVLGMEDLDTEGRVIPVKLNQVMRVKTVTDKTVYTPKDSLLVRSTMTNCSSRELGMSPCLRSVDLFYHSTFWYFIDYTFPSDTEYKLSPGDSISTSFFYPLASIQEPRWEITLPWHCRVWSTSYSISRGLKKVPISLKGIVSADGWFLLPGIHSLNLPISSWDIRMNDGFLLAEITIIE